MRAMKRLHFAILAGALFAAAPQSAPAVSLSPDGMGQALIYPYYTANWTGGNSFNTYFQVKNHSKDAKALRVRFREGRKGVPVFEFNLYLAADDTWTGAIIPSHHIEDTVASIITADTSCTDPEIPHVGLPFLATGFSGPHADGAGDGPGRTREGFVEVLEMGTLTGTSAAAASPPAAFRDPAGCEALRSAPPSIAAPRGGLSGNVTILNVHGGFSFPIEAIALADLATSPYFGPPSDPYPAFTASEIAPVSVTVHGNQVFRSEWPRPVDAVSAVLMRREWRGEFLVGGGTASITDMVVTLPTRHFHLATPGSAGPFEGGDAWTPNCEGKSGHPITGSWMDRSGSGRGLFAPEGACDFGGICNGAQWNVCASAAVAAVTPDPPGPGRPPRSSLLGSATLGLHDGEVKVQWAIDGWIKLHSQDQSTMTSLPSSSRIDMTTGAIVEGAHRFEGLPVVGFTALIYQNGTLACDQGTCMATFGASFPLRYHHAISLVP
jgi:hypothetical protein